MQNLNSSDPNFKSRDYRHINAISGVVSNEVRAVDGESTRRDRSTRYVALPSDLITAPNVSLVGDIDKGRSVAKPVTEAGALRCHEIRTIWLTSPPDAAGIIRASGKPAYIYRNEISEPSGP